MKPIEDRMRKVEAAVRKLDEDHWNKSNPEKQARSRGSRGAAQARSRSSRTSSPRRRPRATPRKIKDAEEALAARKVWLDALGS